MLDFRHMWLPRVLTLLLGASGAMFMTLWSVQAADDADDAG